MKQKLFNKAAVHLLRQKQTSENSTSVCQYRGPNGLMCALGIFIPDSEYQKWLEGMTAEELVGKTMPLHSVRHHLQLFSDLQQLHDNESPEDWESLLQEMADEEELTMPKLEDFPNPLVPGLPE